ncbi:MAG: UDP-N-acetylmuramoyl-L-alanyl-D-glutamate--2,6-diaminopimelate ligase, partial [Muribaculaceae bacterium]|nr:UDP-N-acetylmuramoyl-L-alanyl-D-glutamate--2,6-diaminopimelate ligase [Muribaculaceae bacterium]
NVLDTIRDIVRPAGGEITTVVGCGGTRAPGKRPMMAHEAALRSDHLVITSDNPRDEDPADIINQMKEGLTPSEMRHTICIADRREAIRAAIQAAKPGSVVLVAGKGHEPYQEVAGVRHHFDDREEVQAALAELS